MFSSVKNANLFSIGTRSIFDVEGLSPARRQPPIMPSSFGPSWATKRRSGKTAVRGPTLPTKLQRQADQRDSFQTTVSGIGKLRHRQLRKKLGYAGLIDFKDPASRRCGAGVPAVVPTFKDPSQNQKPIGRGSSAVRAYKFRALFEGLRGYGKRNRRSEHVPHLNEATEKRRPESRVQELKALLPMPTPQKLDLKHPRSRTHVCSGKSSRISTEKNHSLSIDAFKQGESSASNHTVRDNKRPESCELHLGAKLITRNGCAEELRCSKKPGYGPNGWSRVMGIRELVACARNRTPGRRGP